MSEAPPAETFQGPIRIFCPKCDKAVYSNEAKPAAGKQFHPMCYRCITCNKMLESTTVSWHGVELMCKNCYEKKFRVRGNPGAATQFKDDDGKPILVGGPKLEEGGCPRCGRKVHEAEKRAAGGKEYHAPCFSCKMCRRMLDASTQCDKKGEVYCTTCYGKNFGGIGKK